MEMVLLGRHLILLTPMSVGLSFEHFDCFCPQNIFSYIFTGDGGGWGGGGVVSCTIKLGCIL